MPRISLVTPTFNQASTLRETIRSVLGQTYADLEYWVIDAGSQDGTVEILREFEHDPRFHWISEPDGGQSEAINKGLARCTGEVFNWLNSDDYLEPGALGQVAESFRRNPAPDMVSGLTAEFHGEPPIVFNRLQLPLRRTAEATITVGVFCQPSTFWRTEVFRALGGVDASLHYVMDWDLWVRYLAQYGQEKVLLLDSLLAHFRHHADAKTASSSDKFYEEARSVFFRMLLAAEAPAAMRQLEGSLEGASSNQKITTNLKFDRDRYLGAYAERMVRVHRRRNPALARRWLAWSWRYKPWITPWRIKMLLRLLFR